MLNLITTTLAFTVVASHVNEFGQDGQVKRGPPGVQRNEAQSAVPTRPKGPSAQ